MSNITQINNDTNEIIVTDQRIIDMVNIDELSGVMERINKFQTIIKQTLKQNRDYGIIPNTTKKGRDPKPTLLKPGAEKILMLLGLRSEFDIADNTRDFERGFFQYQVKCKLFKGEFLITEGMGAANTKEKKYAYSDGFSVDNTVLKMAKKRALVDAALMVGSLSELFTQDLEDMDLSGQPTQPEGPQIVTDQDGLITKKQAKRMFAISMGNNNLVASVMKKYGYTHSKDVKKLHYDDICQEIEDEANKNLPEALKEGNQG